MLMTLLAVEAFDLGEDGLAGAMALAGELHDIFCVDVDLSGFHNRKLWLIKTGGSEQLPSAITSFFPITQGYCFEIPFTTFDLQLLFPFPIILCLQIPSQCGLKVGYMWTKRGLNVD